MLDDDDDDDEDEEGEDDGRPELKGRARGLKKVVDPAKEKEQKEQLAAKKRDAAAEKAKSKKEAASASAAASAKRTVSSWEAEDKLTEEELDKRVAELMATRGRKNTDHRDVLRQLEVLTKISRLHGPRKEIPLLMHLISSMLDFHRSIDDYMDHHQWRTCHRSLTRVLALLGSNSSIVLGILGSDEVTDLSLNAHLKKQQPEEDGAVPVVTAADPRALVIRVLGSLESFIIRLQDEYTKSLQQINPHTKVSIVGLVPLTHLPVVATYLPTFLSTTLCTTSKYALVYVVCTVTSMI
jgi:translation initiation factor 3 subunit C